MIYRVFIVDDEKLLRQGFIHMENWSEYEFSIAGEASDGEEALRLIEKQKPDIVVTDIRMPRMDGVELTKILKQKYPEIQVIVLSSYNDFDYVKETLKVGALDYILKPKMKFSDLLESLQKAKEVILQSRRRDENRNDTSVDQHPFNHTFYGKEVSYRPKSAELMRLNVTLFKQITQLLDNETLVKMIYEQMDQFIDQGIYLDPVVLKKSVTEIFYYLFHRLNYLGVELSVENKKLSYLIKIENASNYEELKRDIQMICGEIEQAWKERKRSNHGIDDVLAFIEANYDQKITLESVAAEFHFNKSYFCQLFKKHTGENFNHYLAMLRIEKAKVLLRQSNQSVYSICRQVGYSNSSYFGKVFKQVVGISPSEYILLYKN